MVESIMRGMQNRIAELEDAVLRATVSMQKEVHDEMLAKWTADVAERDKTIEALTETWEECERRADSLLEQLDAMQKALLQSAREIRSHEKRITERDWAITNLKARVGRLTGLLGDLLTYLPDGMRYQYVWDECLSHERDEVKIMRARMEAILTEKESEDA